MKSSIVRSLFRVVIFFILLPIYTFAQRNFIYIYHDGYNFVTGYSVGPDGTLTRLQGSPLSTGASENGGGTIGIREATSAQAGNHIYVSNKESHSISVFT